MTLIKTQPEALENGLSPSRFFVRPTQGNPGEIQKAIDGRIRRSSRVRDRMQEELLRETFLIETSGFDATAGFIDMAVREIGADRIVFGSHLPSRSLGTELTKITTATITEDDKAGILGANFRNLLPTP